MSSTTDPVGVSRNSWPHLGSMITVAASWSLAGGVAGGVLASGFIISGRMHPDGALVITAALAAIGSLLGIVHGAILGHLGRSADDHHVWSDIVLGGLAALAGLVVANLLSLLLVLGSLLARAGITTGWVALFLLAPVCLGVLLWATVLGWHTLETAYMRWPEHRLGGWLVAGAFAVIAFVFLTLRPAIPGTRLQLSWWATLVLAATATLWIAAPAVVATLRLMHHNWRGRATVTDR